MTPNQRRNGPPPGPPCLPTFARPPRPNPSSGPQDPDIASNLTPGTAESTATALAITSRAREVFGDRSNTNRGNVIQVREAVKTLRGAIDRSEREDGATAHEVGTRLAWL